MTAIEIEIVGGAGPVETAVITRALADLIAGEPDGADRAVLSAWVRSQHPAWQARARWGRPPPARPATRSS